MFTASDPRSTLAASTTATPDKDAPIAAVEFADFAGTAPQIIDGETRTWVSRAQNVVLAWVTAPLGAVLNVDEPEEHLVLLPHADSAVTVRADGTSVELTGQGLVVVPPGPAEIEVRGDGELVRLVHPDGSALTAQAANAESYREPHPRVAIVEAWPEPADGARLRVYPVGQLERDPDRFGRILRTRRFMVNFLFPHEGPRDAEKLSPHFHDDFEQVSLAVSGEFVHHIRTPWTTKRSQWVDDVHHAIGSPSVAIIPPPTDHTSEAVGPGTNQLIDIFAPPRVDFSQKPGWVLNADTYPMPS
ncbi:hypothetical protein [Schumannella sp. 10F1B-5-1]|uniref:hypothetical protein n=1 Tax=Schumannella sp. 10F1B-5-1 TaxID=2590780 RepID=UPI001130A73F|nr:hypothetical protein [Schumannella sp. 10F1B-5-1]TPW78249.1 hypothetical protein FJ658_00105 [Schumannella sp. 10F1B-5-1]